MNHNFHIILTMKSIKYILAISAIVIFKTADLEACGPFPPYEPELIRMFRCCSPDLERQWHEGCRFQDYEKDENCLLWQDITSSEIPLRDIRAVVYDAQLKDLRTLPRGPLANNQFAQWLLKPEHKEDMDYIGIAKEIEEIRDFMTDPWYYAYDGDEEHLRLDELLKTCLEYKGNRHADRYALQLTRLYFARKEFGKCIDLWESSAGKLPQNIVTDMIASYVGGAYSRKGSRDKAIELFTRSQDIGSLIALKVWNDSETDSHYTDSRIKELEYIFNRFPNSPLLSVKLQGYIRNRENYTRYFEDLDDVGYRNPVYLTAHWVGDTLVVDDEPVFYNELKQFARRAIASLGCRQKAMWQYALAYIYYLDNDYSMAALWLNRAEQTEATPFIKESIRAFRFLMDATYADNSVAYRRKLLKELQWLDERLKGDVNLVPGSNWQYDNKLNIAFSFWQDVTRKVLLGKVCPAMQKNGNATLALQLANYASNRILQLYSLYEAYHIGYHDEEDSESYNSVIPFEDYRKSWSQNNWFDYDNQFFDMINGVSAREAADYAIRIEKPVTELETFLNSRSYVNSDYICDIVGTLYLREMNYDEAVRWLSKVSTDYQNRTNLGKEGYFKLDPFRYQFDKRHYITDTNDYKLRFAQEMLQLEQLINSDAEVNRKANAKIRYATGIRNSFGRCWYLTYYGLSGSSEVREVFADNDLGRRAYIKVDFLYEQALSEFTDPEQAAQAQLEMMNFSTVINKYPESQAASYFRGRCDNYYDYTLQLL